MVGLARSLSGLRALYVVALIGSDFIMLRLAFVIALVWLTGVLVDALLREAHRRGRDLERVLIVGDGEQAQLVEAKIRSAPELGYRIAGFVGNGSPNPRVQPVLGGLEAIPRIVREHRIGEVIIAWAGISPHPTVALVTGRP